MVEDYTELAAYLPELKAELRVAMDELVRANARVEHLQKAIDGFEGLQRQRESLPDERTSE